MSRRNKLLKFSELQTFANVYENFDMKVAELSGINGNVDLHGKWNELHFKNDHPITLELACGRGEYTLDLARKYPNRNFIGVDIKGARIWQGAKIGLEEKLDNAAFLRTKIELITPFFSEGEIDEIWITFPDPFLKESKANRRLTAPSFLNIYRKILKDGGIVQLKTDDPTLYEFTQETLAEDPKVKVLYDNPDIYSAPLEFEALETKTYYEKMHLKKGRKIRYIRFTIH